MSGQVKFSPMPPKEAVNFLKSKGYALGFDWRDVWKEEHAIAFTVAKAASVDLLQTIKNEVDNALEKGLTFESFKNNLKPLLVKRGWWGKATQIDPLTGAEKKVMLGSNRRLNTIWRTNIDMAYAAGNWQHIEETRRTHPYLQYKNRDPARARPQHQAWNNIVLRSDDPWWDSHYPPNGWNCKCWVRQISKHEVESGRFSLSQAPEIQTVPYRNKRTGEILQVPEGIDPGFDYNVGKARARVFTPPPLGGLPQTSQTDGNDLPIMAAPAPIPENAIMPAKLNKNDYVRAFLSEFGIKPGATSYFSDKTGDVLPINVEMFRNSGRTDTSPYIKLMALGIIEPDEIWLQWVKNSTGAWLLQKRYLKRWLGNKETPNLTIFDKSADGWRGAALSAEANNYRSGLLLYKKA